VVALVDLVIDGGVDMNMDLDMVATFDAWPDQPARASCRFSASPRIARGEAMESASSFDVFQLRKLVSPEPYGRGIVLLEGVVAMLTRRLWPSKVETQFKYKPRSMKTAMTTSMSTKTSRNYPTRSS